MGSGVGCARRSPLILTDPQSLCHLLYLSFVAQGASQFLYTRMPHQRAHRFRAFAPQPAQKLQSAHPRHFEIQQNRVRHRIFSVQQIIDSLLAVVRHWRRLEPKPLKRKFHQPDIVAVILDEEEAGIERTHEQKRQKPDGLTCGGSLTGSTGQSTSSFVEKTAGLAWICSHCDYCLDRTCPHAIALCVHVLIRLHEFGDEADDRGSHGRFDQVGNSSQLQSLLKILWPARRR